MKNKRIGNIQCIVIDNFSNIFYFIDCDHKSQIFYDLCGRNIRIEKLLPVSININSFQNKIHRDIIDRSYNHSLFRSGQFSWTPDTDLIIKDGPKE